MWRSAAGRLWLRVIAALMLAFGLLLVGLAIACLAQSTTVSLVFVCGAVGLYVACTGACGLLSVGSGSRRRVTAFTALYAVLVAAQCALVLGVFAFHSETERWFSGLKDGNTDGSGSAFSKVNDLVTENHWTFEIAAAVALAVQLTGLCALLACARGVAYREGDADDEGVVLGAGGTATAGDALLSPEFAYAINGSGGGGDRTVSADGRLLYDGSDAEKNLYHGDRTPRGGASAGYGYGAGGATVTSTERGSSGSSGSVSVGSSAYNSVQSVDSSGRPTPKTDALRAAMNEKYGGRFPKRRAIQIEDDQPPV